MSRIRSVHPGLFTDEAFMALSPSAMIAWIGLWCEADDQGVFEWKPMTLKARLLPCAAINMIDVLAEYESGGMICRYEVDGKQYAAIKNFRKFQRPEKPKAWHPLPDSLRPFVGLDAPDHASRRPVAERSPTAHRKSSQMEDVGDKREEKKDSSDSTAPICRAARDLDFLEHECREAAGVTQSPAAGLMNLSPIIRCLDAGASLESDVIPTLRGMRARQIKTWAYAVDAIMDAKASREAPVPIGRATGPPRTPKAHEQASKLRLIIEEAENERNREREAGRAPVALLAERQSFG